ncbi:MAG: TonB-dependent receptor [Pseudomonadota bacterium]
MITIAAILRPATSHFASVSVLVTLVAHASAAQDSSPEIASTVIEETVVTATRTARSITEIARSILVLEPLVLEENLIKTSNLGDLLGASVPGFGAPSALDITRTQTLRGRGVQYLLDGVPLSYNSGAGFGGSPLVRFDPEVLGRVEVLYGPTSVFGAGATGGVIQFLTRDAQEDDPLRVRLRLQTTTYTGADNPFDDEALSFKPTIALSGDLGNFDYLATYSYDSQNAIFDGDGDLVNPVFYGFSDDQNYFLKLGFDLDDVQRIDGWFNFVEREPDGRTFNLALDEDGTATGVEQPGNFQVDLSANPRIDEKKMWNLRYQHQNLYGGALTLQYYGRDDERAGSLNDLRLAAFLPSWPAFWPSNYQALSLDEGYGFRTQFAFDPSESLSLVVGIDYEEQDRQSNALVYEIPEDFDETGSLGPVLRDDLFAFPFELETLGVFVQGEYEPFDGLRLSAGLRWEDVSFSIGSGTRVFETTVVDGAQVARPGGVGESDDLAFNLGVSYDVAAALTVFANFAQGYEVPQLSSVAGQVPPDAQLVSDDAVKPQIVDNYELGLRGVAHGWRYSLATFYSDSELGENFIYDPITGMGEYNRAPQENYGFELVLGWAPTQFIDVLAAVSWNEGDFDPDGDGPEGDVPLSTLDVSPWKATLNVRYDITASLQLNGQLLVVGDRDRAFDEGVDLYEITGYETLDLGLNYNFSRSRVSVQITNVFDKDYITPASQTYIGNLAFLPRVAGAPGRALSLAINTEF